MFNHLRNSFQPITYQSSELLNSNNELYIKLCKNNGQTKLENIKFNIFTYFFCISHFSYFRCYHCMSLYVTVCHCMSLYVTVCHCMSLYVTVCHCRSL